MNYTSRIQSEDSHDQSSFFFFFLSLSLSLCLSQCLSVSLCVCSVCVCAWTIQCVPLPQQFSLREVSDMAPDM